MIDEQKKPPDDDLVIMKDTLAHIRRRLVVDSSENARTVVTEIDMVLEVDYEPTAPPHWDDLLPNSH